MPRSISKTDQMANINFVLTVKRYPCLYNSSLKEYSSREAVEAAWQKVAKNLQESVEDCKEKWKNLRTVFVRKRKTPPGGSSKRVPYYLNTVMQFIVPFIKVQNNEDAFLARTYTASSSESNLFSENIEIKADPEQSEEEEEQADNDTFETLMDDELLNNKNNSKQSQDLEEAERTATETVNEESNGSRVEKRKSATNIDDVLKEYFEERKDQSIANMQAESARKTFLLSLIPEVEAMTYRKFRQFRRHVLDAIDNALCPDQNNDILQ